MPWKDRNLMSLKIELLEKLLNRAISVTKLCLEFGISRKTAYKWVKRFKERGLQGVENHSRRPLTSPSRVSEEVVSLILNARAGHHWGARKLRQYLLNKGVQNLPSEATFNRILSRHGQIESEESEKRQHFIRFEREVPNELWQMDFKGYFTLASKGACHPLTILDDHSRFSICIKACERANEENVREGLEQAFRKYGLPEGMTMDNGAPWRSGQTHLSRITVWLMRLGIQVSHSSPGHPQTQGKLERFHRSLKEEVLKFHQFSNLKNAQMRFDEWREIYNNERPHEGIGLLCPKDRYKPSARVFPEQLPEVYYPDGLEVKKVSVNGEIYFRGKRCFVGEHLAEEFVGIQEKQGGICDVYFYKTRIQRIHFKTRS